MFTIRFIHIFLLLKRLGILFLIYFLLRVFFLFFNRGFFVPGNFGDLVPVFWYGMRFDIAAILMSNGLLVLLHLLPPPFFQRKGYQHFLKIIFYTINIPFILLNCVDFEYFRFAMRRSTADIFQIIAIDTGVVNTIPNMIVDFWHIGVVIAILIALMEILYRRANKTLKMAQSQHPGFDIPTPQPARSQKIKNIAAYIFISLLIIAASIIGARGGIQLRPLGIIHSGAKGAGQYSSFILNTTFTFIKSMFKAGIREVSYFNEAECQKIFSIYHDWSKRSGGGEPMMDKKARPVVSRKLNVMIIVLESFSKEYVGELNSGKGITPFLDSLCREGLVFTNAYSNGKRTIEGIPAIVSGIPALMNNPYITSIYSGNRINSIASVLNECGYKSAFFHGGINGTMGFDGFCRMAGFKEYYGKNEYDNDNDFDGNWGIFDHKFLHYTAGKLNNIEKPFVAVALTVSSHHPFTIPQEFNGMFENAKDPMEKSIIYTDHSLRLFFNTISKSDWFDSTVFVITADHAGPVSMPCYSTRVGVYQVPILFYMRNSELKGRSEEVIQHTDIFPTLLHILKYKGKFASFGTSALDTSAVHDAVNYFDNTYQIISDGYSLFYSDDSTLAFYEYKKDSLLQHNLVLESNTSKFYLEKRIKAIIQTFNRSMIHNELIDIQN